VNTLLRVSLFTGALVIVVFGLRWSQPECTQKRPFQETELSDPSAGVMEADAHVDALEQRRRIAVARLHLRERIVQDLCAHRFSLLEAASRFRELDNILPVRHPNNTDDERYRLEVIHAVQWHLRSLGLSNRSIAAHLRAEHGALSDGDNLFLPTSR
jgi:hypothetical protein